MNKLIACHDAATGEKGKGFLSWLLTPFARTQSKSLKEQYLAGCRMFDLRFKQDSKGTWRCFHGLWKTNKTAYELLKELDELSNNDINITLTYEGYGDKKEEFLNFISICKQDFQMLRYGPVAVKYGDEANLFKVKYTYILNADPDFDCRPCYQYFNPLDGRDLRILLPIPWLWKKLGKFRKVEFVENEYRYVDFL
jgi:hypothetical protein